MRKNQSSEFSYPKMVSLGISARSLTASPTRLSIGV